MELLRIVIAEKDPLIRKNLKEMLAQAGHKVIGEAEDGMSGLKMIRSLHPEMVLTASVLPVLSGLEMAKIIEESRLCPVVMMIDYGERELVHNAENIWPFPVLVKPFDEFQLVSVMDYAYSVFHRMVSLEKEVHKLKNDLQTRKLVEKAKGILMKAHGYSEEVAFKKMQQQSMKKRAPMKKIAEAIVTAYELTKG